MKVFITRGFSFYINILLLLAWPIASFILFILDIIHIGLFLTSPVASLLLFLLGLNFGIRKIVIKNGIIFVPDDPVLIRPTQHRVNVKIDDIDSIKYIIADTDSLGNRYKGGPSYPPDFISTPYLSITVLDGSMFLICIRGFTTKQIMRIQETLLKENPNITVVNCPNELLSLL